MSEDRGLTLGPAGLGRVRLEYADLHDPAGLAALHGELVAWLEREDAESAGALAALASAGDAIDARARSAAIVRLAPYVSRFVARLFDIEAEVIARRHELVAPQPIFAFRKHVAKKRVLGAASASSIDIATAHRVARVIVLALGGEGDEELRTARAAMALHALDETARRAAKSGGASVTDELAEVARVAREAIAQIGECAGGEADGELAARLLDALATSLRARLDDPADDVARWTSLARRRDLDWSAGLVPLRVPSDARARTERAGDGHARRQRVEPFGLTDARMSERAVLGELDVCLDCHARDKDSCSKGLRDKSGAVRENPLGISLEGCPLDEPIGEMNELYRDGDPIAALVAVTISNPMCPGTGHRICNDCMKACVFQKEAPVNVPEIETRVLTDVLALPWGFEIWSLLARWNPLRVARPYPLPYRGKNVLVVGLGPAGYTLAHYLTQEGFGVVAIDGLKIEPLPASLVGGEGRVPAPVRDASALREPLDARVVRGFGGVSEYGITVRWDKSFLTLLSLELTRRRSFRVYDGVRFGGTLTLDDAWALGFDHVAIAAGAGRPTQIDVPNGLARGVRQASDFLMALQLTGAFKRSSLAALDVRLPAVVIGGGLTAIDTATELLAYYVVQAERTLERVEALGEAALFASLDDEERAVLEERLAHARALREEREAAAREGRTPDLGRLLDAWGGVRVVYRRRLVDAPAYRLNHEEVEKALEEGVRFVELLAPGEVHVDGSGRVEAMTFHEQELDERGALRATGVETRLPARSVLVAAGTRPNVTYERERPASFEIDPRTGYFVSHVARRGADGALALERGDGFFTSHRGPSGQLVSYYGDNHPRYAGNVVKAMASAKHGHVEVARLFAESDVPADDARWRALVARLDGELVARVHAVRALAPGIFEVVVHAPRAARAFSPGQFYRLQTYETGALRRAGTSLVTEGVALTGAWIDPEAGLVSVIVLELGASTRLSFRCRPGERVVLMGPTGAPTEIPKNEKVLLVGGGHGNAVLFSLGRALREAGSEVLYVAGYRRGELLFKQDEVEASADQVIWATDGGAPIAPRRAQDRHVRANVIEAMSSYERGELGPKIFGLGEVDRILVIGSDGMMAAVKAARHGALREQLGKARVALGSINSPMQCMMKEVCGQCLQRRVDPATGREKYVYTCFEQDQPLDEVDFAFLRQRLRQSSAEEKIAAAWLDHVTHDDAAE